MRALLSWDIDVNDPEYDQVLVALGACLPSGKVRLLTNCSALIDPINARQFNRLFLEIEALAAAFTGRLFFVLSLHEKRGPIWGVYRGPSSSLVISEPGRP